MVGASGCATTAGLLIARNHAASFESLDPGDTQSLAAQEQVTVTTRDGTIFVGKFIGTRFIGPEPAGTSEQPDTAGAADMPAVRRAEEAEPAIGDTIHIVIVSQPERAAVFLGLQTTETDEGCAPAIRIRNVGWQMDHVHPLADIRAMKDAAGVEIDPSILQSWTSTPALAFQCDAGPVVVPVRDVLLIQKPSTKWQTPVLIGIMVDAAALAVAVWAIEDALPLGE